MSIQLENSTSSGSLAELIQQLGDVPLSRIRRTPAPGSATEQDVLQAEAAVDKRLCELVDGVLVEKPMGFNESLLAAFLVRVIGNFVAEQKLGIVACPDGMVRLSPQQVRIPDVAYYSWTRLPGRKPPTTPIPAIAPDLAIEILSASNTRREMERKRSDYFAAGVHEIWEVEPIARTIDVYRNSGDVQQMNSTQRLETELLPGFQLKIADLFAILDGES